MPVPVMALIMLLFGLQAAACRVEDARERPNFLLILADDLGYSDLGCYGGEISTPHLDRLADRGLRFTQFYNDARCCPTRASLLTGLHPHQAGMGAMVTSVDGEPEPGPYQGYLSRDSVTLAEVLREAGYRTYLSGKWHVGEKREHWPRTRGFERYFGLISGANSYFEIIREQPRVRQMALDDDPWEPPAEGFYMTDAITDHSVQWLREHQATTPGSPFLMFVSYTAPHWPLHALPEDIDRYEGKYLEGWDAIREGRFARMRQMGLLDERFQLTPRSESIPAWEEVDEEERKVWDRRMAVYAAMVDRMDRGIGRIVGALSETGALENTLVLFLSDNGASAEGVLQRGLHDPDVPIGLRGSYQGYKEPWANASNTPFRWYKSWIHEGGIATPLIAHWPRGVQAPGGIVRSFGHVVDIMATFCELAEVPYPDTFGGRAVKPLVGKSLVPFLEGRPRQGHEAFFWEHFGDRGVRQGRWKLVYGRRVGEWELYDMERDPTEMHDLADEHPERVDQLKARWQEWAEGVGVRTRS